MRRAGDEELTILLRRWSTGDDEAAERVFETVYNELRRIAGRMMRNERRNHSLQPTEIVHEAYLNLERLEAKVWESRTQFFGMAARIMRWVLVDHARRRMRQKRGGGLERVELDPVAVPLGGEQTDLLDLDVAMKALQRQDPRKVEIVELRFFGGLTVMETAQQLSLSRATVIREWRSARAWLIRELRTGAAGGEQ